MSETESFYVRLGAALFRERHHRGMTQRQVAAALGVVAPTIVYWESGRNRMRIGDFVWICALLDVDPGDVLRHVAEARQPHTGKEPS